MSASIRDAFPPDDALARCLVSLSAATNAIDPALRRAHEAAKADDPEFSAHVLALTGYVLEGSKALGAYRERFVEVRAFLKTLRPEARDDIKTVTGLGQKVGRGVLDHSRDSTFHFPRPDNHYYPDSDTLLAEVLEALGGEPATLIPVTVEGSAPRVRLHFADRATLLLALGRHAIQDEEELRRQLAETQRAAGAFVRFVTEAVTVYLTDHRGATFGEPSASDPS